MIERTAYQLKETFLFGSVTGYIGGLIEITTEEYNQLLSLQQVLLKHMSGIIECHNEEEWKKVVDDWKKLQCKNIIDGYIVEQYLNLSVDKQKEIADECHFNWRKCVEMIENIGHHFH